VALASSGTRMFRRESAVIARPFPNQPYLTRCRYIARGVTEGIVFCLTWSAVVVAAVRAPVASTPLKIIRVIGTVGALIVMAFIGLMAYGLSTIIQRH